MGDITPSAEIQLVYSVAPADWAKYKNAMSYIEQIMEATSHETVAVRPLPSHL